MKKTKLLLSIFLSIGILSFISCEDKSDDRTGNGSGNNGKEKGDNEYVNDWLMTKMSDNYLWNDKLPAANSLDFSKNPKDFFDDLIAYERAPAPNGRGKIHSTIEGTHASISDFTKSSTSPDLGFEYMGINFTDNNGSSLFYRNLVIYVKRGSLAEKAGLKRGSLISEVDGVPVTKNNWFSALAQNQPQYEIKYAKNKNEMDKSLFHTLTIKKTPNYDDTPIFLDSIYTEGSRKIGYIVYNSFECGPRSSMPYDVAMMQKFQKFKDAGITDVILDFRYNGGGYVSSAQAIASALVPDRSSRKIFEVQVYNKTTNKVYTEYFIDNVFNSKGQSLVSIPRLGNQLDNIYVIGTAGTASASEMIINTLRPYMQEKGKNVYLIGQKTHGKNVGSQPYYEENDKRNTYVIWPIIFQSHNKLYTSGNPQDQVSSPYENGFEPDESVRELDYIGQGLEELGSRDEALLKVALDKIRGVRSIKAVIEQKADYSVLGLSLERKHGNNMFISKEEVENRD